MRLVHRDVKDPPCAPSTQGFQAENSRRAGLVGPPGEPRGGNHGAPVGNVPPLPPLTGIAGVTSDMSGPSQRTRGWTFLSKQNRTLLRRKCCDFKAEQCGTKTELEENSFKRLCYGREYDTIWRDPFLTTNEADVHYMFSLWDAVQNGQTMWETASVLTVPTSLVHFLQLS